LVHQSQQAVIIFNDLMTPTHSAGLRHGARVSLSRCLSVSETLKSTNFEWQ